MNTMTMDDGDNIHCTQSTCLMCIFSILTENEISGAVSVQQQLSIVGRMCRTYPFLKVVSTGHLFQYEGFRHM
jgi:hypothetical protein